MLLLPLYHLYSADTLQPGSLALLYLFNLAALIASFRLKPYSAAVKKLPASAWLEQHLLLALILTLLCWFYLPQAPFIQPQAQWLWLSTQLTIMGLLLRLCWAVKKQPVAPATSGQNWLVGYASQSGMAQQLAQFPSPLRRQLDHRLPQPMLAAWARRATTSVAVCCLARRVAPQKQRLRRCKSSPGHQPGCGVRLAATICAGQRAP